MFAYILLKINWNARKYMLVIEPFLANTLRIRQAKSDLRYTRLSVISAFLATETA